MKPYVCLSRVFLVLAVLLSDVMCAVVAYSYSELLWGVRCAGFSAPPYAAFVLAIPYALGIAVCALLAWYFGRKA